MTLCATNSRGGFSVRASFSSDFNAAREQVRRNVSRCSPVPLGIEGEKGTGKNPVADFGPGGSLLGEAVVGR